MARELNIIPNLEFLVKQVKKIALGKKSILSSNTVNLNTNYTLTPGGIWNWTGIFNSGGLVFPNPALYTGQTITIAVGGGFFIGVTPNGYEPFDPQFGAPYTALSGGSGGAYLIYKFYSTGTKWAGGTKF